MKNSLYFRTLFCLSVLATVAAPLAAQTGASRRYRYDFAEPPAWRGLGPDLDVRVQDAPRNTFHIVEAKGADRTTHPNPPVWIISRRDPALRVKRTVPQPLPTEESYTLMAADEWFVSPTERYLLADQKIMRGVNGVTLYERVGDSGLKYRPALPTFLSALATSRAIADCKRRGRTYGEWLSGCYFFTPIGWHGPGDRYLDIELDVDHGPLVWRGSYDTVRHRFIEDEPPAFGPHGPRAPGEKFPETRTRRLTAADIAHWSYAEVRYAVNEIYARYGYTFPDDPWPIQRQFRRFEWYRQDFSLHQAEQVTPHVTAIERANLPILIRRRDALHSAGAR